MIDIFSMILAGIVTFVSLVLGCVLLASPLILIAVLTGCVIKSTRRRDTKQDIVNGLFDYKNRYRD